MSESVPLAYATATPHRPRVLAGAVISIAGLVLILFGGCFLIGVMIQLQTAAAFNNAPPKQWLARDYVFHIVLYLMAFGCFVSGGLLIFKAIAALFQIIRER